MNPENSDHQAYDLVYSKDHPEGDAHAWIQWKGTDACLDIHCACGVLGHVDGEFVYSVKCKACGRKYAMGQNIKLIELDTPELQAANERYHGDYHEFSEEGGPSGR